MQKLSAGDTAVTLRYRERTDEIGRMIEAIEIFRSNALEIQKIQQLRRQAEEQQASERRTEMAALAEEFDSSVKHITSARRRGHRGPRQRRSDDESRGGHTDKIGDGG
jgi:hypothetical protein